MMQSTKLHRALCQLEKSAQGQFVRLRLQPCFHTKSSALDGAVTVKTPLCQRPSVAVVGLGKFLEWKRKTEAKIAEIGDTFHQLDNGPTADDLNVGFNFCR